MSGPTTGPSFFTPFDVPKTLPPKQPMNATSKALCLRVADVPEGEGFGTQVSAGDSNPSKIERGCATRMKARILPIFSAKLPCVGNAKLIDSSKALPMGEFFLGMATSIENGRTRRKDHPSDR